MEKEPAKNFRGKKKHAFRAYVFGLACLTCIVPALLFAQAVKPVKPQSPVAVNSSGKLVYASDSNGDRIPDYSYSGYKASSASIPEGKIKITVPLVKGDATALIQAAIDRISAMPADDQGLRGVVLLQKGRYEVSSISIPSSGVVLKGSGAGANGTTLFAFSHDRETLIRIAGKNDRVLSAPVNITAPYSPVNAMTLKIASGTTLQSGDRILVHRPSTRKWIDALGTDHFGGGVTALGWKPAQRDIYWDRQVMSVRANEITLDAPITTAIDTNYSLGSVSKYNWPGRIINAGVEDLRCVSAYDPANRKDEAHAWMAIVIENAADAWVRRVNFEYFAGSAVAVMNTASRVTVEDCKSLSPVSENGGQRRNTFFTEGQQTLFQRCYAEFGYHDFAVGFCAAGPNAFVQCESHLPSGFSGAIDSWASGVLFDIVNVDGQALSFMNRGQDGQGAGWAAANSMFWQCSASRIDCYRPPTANNWAYGCWAQFAGDGYWESSNEQIKPRSFFYAQLKDRLGALPAVTVMPFEGEASSSPPVSVAMELTRQAYQPLKTLAQFIDEQQSSKSADISTQGISSISKSDVNKPPVETLAPAMKIINGWLVRGDQVLSGMRVDVPWWSGSSRPYAVKDQKPAITRFVPGKTGAGLTDDLDVLTDSMRSRGQIGMEQNYALWYDRRRDDHERIRRMDGDVWPPFYEVPFARSGKDTAWDGLSKYDLTKYNTWYWNRLKTFASLADKKGLLLVHQNYFQHNIIEAGAHYADFTWRPANNINNTGFPEPVPYAGDKRIFMAEQFYDITNPVRRKIHVAYIRQCLNNFTANNGVIQLIGAEFTGPTHFVRFWLSTIRDWEKETGKNAVIGLSTTKDVQDSILADKSLAQVVDIIDIRYWHYREDGSTYEPKGGQNLAPRQHARLIKPGKSSFEQIYRAVKEYRDRTGKAVMYSGDGWDANGWAVLMAGGSLPVLPASIPKEMLTLASSMHPVALPGSPAGQWAIGSPGKGFIIYANSGEKIQLDLTNGNGQWKACWINIKTGEITKTEIIEGGKPVAITRNGNLLMLKK